MLTGKRLLITGVLTRESIAYSVAERAQRSGAEIMLTGFGRTRRMTERAARRLPERSEVLTLDVNCPGDLEALSDEVGAHWDRLDGVLHAIAHAPPEALGEGFLHASPEAAAQTFRTSTFSLKALTASLLPLLRPHGGSVVGLTFDSSVAWPGYGWMGVAKAALEATGRYLAADLGSAGIRVNLVSAGPLFTPAAGGVEDLKRLAARWAERAPLGWDPTDATAVADVACFLLSDLSRALSGEVLHVDGGFHAVGAPTFAAP